jgi:hypothetical protein
MLSGIYQPNGDRPEPSNGTTLSTEDVGLPINDRLFQIPNREGILFDVFIQITFAEL